MSWISVLLHELSHFLSASGFGLYSKINLGNRLQFLVAQTKIYNVYSIDIKKRISIYASGIVTDLWTIFICMIFINLFQYSVVISILRCLIFIKIGAIVWQFLFYMKTDVYYILSNILKQNNLMQDSMDYIKKQNTSRYTSNTVKYYSYFLLWVDFFLFCFF